jgi:hypothetical protein
MTERRDEQERGDKKYREGDGEGRHARHDRVERGWFIDEVGESPSDADVESGVSRRAERYED